MQRVFAEQTGREVELHDERPSNSSALRAIIRVAPALLARLTRKHFLRILNTTEHHQYSLVIVIKGEVTPLWFLQALRTRNPNAVFAFYSFDSITNSSRCRSIFEAFDYLYSFDRADVAAIDELDYKPLFFTAEFTASSSNVARYDLSFVGTVHSNRYQLASSVSRALPTSRLFMFYYVQASWYFWLMKLTGAFKGIPRSAVSVRKLSRDDVADVFRSSRAVLDVQRYGQTGLTMRTFEVLASGAALLTTNGTIRGEEFFDEERILILEREGDQSSRVDRFMRELKPVRQDQLHQFELYSLSSWVASFLELVPMQTRAEG